MGWKGTVRSLGALAKRLEREARRRKRELEKKQKELAQMQERERAAYEVEVYQNHIDVLKSLHKDCSHPVDWLGLSKISPPEEPKYSDANEKIAQEALDNYSPSFLDKVFRLSKIKKKTLMDNILKAKQKDEEEYREAHRKYMEESEHCRTIIEIADRVLKGEPGAYIEAVNEMEPFEEIKELGAGINFKVIDSRTVCVTIHVNSDNIIPGEEKRVLKSGKLSVKQMPDVKFNELYQDYVCSTVLRAAREVLALLPVSEVIVNASARMLNPRTGLKEDAIILSALMQREALDRLNMEQLDPSESMSNFNHRMKFRKNAGFGSVEPIGTKELSGI